MTPQRWQQVRSVFDRAVALATDERPDFLKRACAGDGELRDAVERLLRSHRAAETFLEEPFARLVSDVRAGPPPPADLERIGPYRVLRVLGHGGMGTVYLARRDDDEYRREVAVKVLRRELARADLVRRFRSERQILADLDHPHVARLLEGGTTGDGRPYLVMEYVDGAPLLSYCEERALAVGERLELFVKICRAVHFAHQNLVVHRDLKPQNVLVTAGGEPKLLDFGIAKPLDPETFAQTVVATETGRAPMTVRYASPEQVRGESITTATDVYSLGVVLYQLLTGRSPYSGVTGPREILEAICDRPPEPPSKAALRRAAGESGPAAARKLHKTLRGDLDNIVLKALRKEPRRRYASAEDLALDVERYLTHRPIAARPDRLAYRVGKFVRRHRFGVAASAAGLAALVGFLAVLVVQQGRVERQRDRAEEVTRVMVDLFEVSDPEVALGAEITAREVMDRGAREIPERLKGRPLVQADLLETLGQVYRKLGLYRESRSLLEKVLAIRRRAGDADRRALATTLVRYGHVLSFTGATEGAERSYVEALDLLPRSDDPVRAEAIAGLAAVHRDRREYGEAERRKLAALEMVGRIFGPASAEAATELTELANLYYARGDLEAAEGTYQKALATFRDLYGDVHPKVVAVESSLAALARARGQYDRAEALFTAVLADYRRLYGDRHPSLGSVLYSLASLEHDRARYRKAEETAREALDIRREAYGEEHPKVAATLNLLGMIHREQRDLEEAEVHFRQALDVWSRHHGRDHPDVAVGLLNLASVSRQREDFDAAEERYREALAISRATLGPEHPQVATVLAHLALCARGRGDLEAARDLYRQSLDLKRRLLGDDDPQLAALLYNLAVVLRHLGEYQDSEASYRHALRLYRARDGDDHPRVALTLQSLASVLALQDRGEEAEALARRALEIYGKAESYGPDHPWALAARAILGSSLAAQDRYREAETLLVESYGKMRAAPGVGSNLLGVTAERLVALYEAWGKPGEADRYRRRPAAGG